MSTDRSVAWWEQAPSRAISLAVSALLVATWFTLRLVVFEPMAFPLTYVLPLLVCVWTRDRVALWGMAGTFLALHVGAVFLTRPDVPVPAGAMWTNVAAVGINVLVAALVINAIVNLRERLVHALGQLREQAEELTQQNEELAEQAEELSHQTEELTQQGEELASQNEELQSQAVDIGALNDALERRQQLLQALLDVARVSASEQTAIERIASTASDLFASSAAAVAVFAHGPDGLRLLAKNPGGEMTSDSVRDDLVAIAIAHDRTASLNDASLRPDMTLVRVAAHPPFGAALVAPIHVAGTVSGAIGIYGPIPHEWSREEFQLADWLAGQCGRVLETLRVQSDLREADRRKSEFLATLSHELRNPLAPIRFALRMMESGSEHPNALRILQRQVQQLVRLVDDLLDATRLSSNKIQIRRMPTDVVSVVHQAIEACRPDLEEAQHRLSVSVPDEPIWLDADPERIAQVVTNLLNNAIRYTPRGGALTVSVATSGNDAVLTVADTGVGLAPGDLDRVFDMFAQVSGPGSGGLGIGLALVRGIVEAHGGRVDARSDGPGRGSEFRVVLPLSPAEADTSTPHPSPMVAAVGGSRRVLVVDDNRDSAEMMGALLEMHGHQVRIAHDAATALAAAIEFAPQAALLDIGLPDLDGYELARRLRGDERTGHTRLIALTGWGQAADRARAQDAGFDAHLTKPAEPDAILAALNAVAAT